MDFNTALESPSQQAPTPAPVILARNIQKFFKEKSERLKQGGAGVNTSQQLNSSGSGSHHSDLDVNTVLQDVDSILDGRSMEDGHLLLRGMVADLLREVDLLRWRLDETSASLQRVKEERDVVNNDYRDCLLSLILALQQAVGDEAAPNRSLLQSGQLLTADEATTLTITTLTGKIEKLNMEATEKEHELAKARERIEDLQSENKAKIHKIAALEKQFQSINKKRNKVVVKNQQQQQRQQKLADTTNSKKDATAASPFDAGNVSAIQKTPVNAAWNSNNTPTITETIHAMLNGAPTTTSEKKAVAASSKPDKDSAPEPESVTEKAETATEVATSAKAAPSPKPAGTSNSEVPARIESTTARKATAAPNSAHNTSVSNNSISSKPKRKGHVARLVKLVDEI